MSKYQNATVDGHKVFYREAGPSSSGLLDRGIEQTTGSSDAGCNVLGYKR